jgi:hypothetical protein
MSFICNFLLIAGVTDYKIISSNSKSVVIEYTPVIVDSSKTLNGEYLILKVQNGLQSDLTPGNPDIPVRLFNIGVPDITGNTLEIISSSFTEINGRIAPVARYEKKNSFQESFFEMGKNYSEAAFKDETAQFGKSGMIRSVRVQQIAIFPVQFNYSSGKIRIYKSIVFRVNFSLNRNGTETGSDDFSAGSIINYDIAKNWMAAAKQLKKRQGLQSVISEGRWYKFETPEEGIYKITRQMLPSLGIDPNSVDPRTIKIYNNGGKMLPENVVEKRPDDFIENAILISGEEDGKFDDNDYILFYGRGSRFYEYNPGTGRISVCLNYFSNNNYYWITSGGAAGKRITSKTGNNNEAFGQLNTQSFIFYKKELVNVAKSGKHFYGEMFPANSKELNYVNKLTGLVPGSQVDYEISVVNTSIDKAGAELYEGNKLLTSLELAGGNDASYRKGTENQFRGSFSGSFNGDSSVIKIRLIQYGKDCSGLLDYYQLRYDKGLIAEKDFLLFYSKDTLANIEYRLSGFSSLPVVFDASDFSNVKLVTNPVAASGLNYAFRMGEMKGEVCKYIAVSPAAYKTPVNFSAETNGVVKANTTGAKEIIITSPAFLTQANKLKKYREEESPNKLTVEVFTVDNIFKEFSCGQTDPSAIRDFIKYAYENWAIKPEYVLLFGNGNYDYKNITKTNKNFVIPYESDESLEVVYSSYCSDDFYACVSGEDPFVDIALGRVNVNTAAEAEAYIVKIKSYEKNSEVSPWRNTITLIADDTFAGTETDENKHEECSEKLCNEAIPASFYLNKIYLSEYPTVQASSGRTKPGVTTDFVKAINGGTVLFSYIGHANINVLSHEGFFIKDVTIPQLVNNNFAFMTIMGCEFGWYDDPSEQSSAERLILKPDGGAIGVIAASRSVFGTENVSLEKQIYENFFKYEQTTGRFLTVGQAYMNAKAQRGYSNDFRFHLFCDPAIRLLLPKNTGVFDSINGISTDEPDIQIKALQKVNLKGSVRKQDSTLWKEFNGEGILTVYDSEIKKYNEECGIDITHPGGILCRSRYSINNGVFSSAFAVPKDISYENKTGKMVFYFNNNAGEDGIAFYNKAKIGGSDTNSVNDKKGPEIEIFFDNTDIRNTGPVSPNPLLIIKLRDETGLNTTGSGIGHKLEGILDGNNNAPIDFSDFYVADIDSNGCSGKINYRLYDIAPGEHKLKVKAWDVFNNLSQAECEFSMCGDDRLHIVDVYNYPNPFSQSTLFTFRQNLDKPLSVKIRIYTVAGRLIKEIQQDNILERFVKIPWDGLDADRNQVANGVYIYKINVKSADGNYSESVLGKAAVLR